MGKAAGRKVRREDAAVKAAGIAVHIGKCAEEMRVKACDLTWHDFREYAQIAYGHDRLGGVRRNITRFGGFNALRDAHFPPEPTDQAVAKQRVLEHARVNRRLGQDTSHARFVLEQVEAIAKRVFAGRIAPVVAKAAKTSVSKDETTRVLNLVLSDLHFGSDLRAEETGFLDYGRVQEARRLAQVILQAIEYKAEHRAETELRLILGGDIIHGGLHDPRDGAEMAEQICRAIHLLSQAVAQLSAHFKRIRVHCVTGNHGRMLSRHPGRATVGKHDSNETIIYSSVRMCCANLKNVEWSIPKRPYDVYSDFGKKVFVTHGDTVLRPGNPGKNVQTGSLEAQINRFNATLRDKDEYAVFVMGHVHVPLITQLSNGAWVITNGPLIPADNFCVSIGLPETVSAQTMFESVKGYPVGDNRFISLDAAVDNDKSLDRIIHPWDAY
jgi:predicted phosphodiesterase